MLALRVLTVLCFYPRGGYLGVSLVSVQGEQREGFGMFYNFVGSGGSLVVPVAM